MRKYHFLALIFFILVSSILSAGTTELYQYGQFMDKSCQVQKNEQNNFVNYVTMDKQDTVKQSLVATLQYIGLELTIKAIGAFAKNIEYSKEQFEEFSNDLTKNYCSQNISVFSIKKIKNMLLDSYFQESKIYDPIDEKWKSYLEQSATQKRLFQSSVLLFRTLCSWSMDPDNLQLMSILVKNPMVMSYVFYKIIHEKLVWNQKTRKLASIVDEDGISVYCSNNICRRLKKKDFIEVMPKSLGHISYLTDFNRLYCESFKNASMIFGIEKDPMKKWMKNLSIREEYMQTAMLVSLMDKNVDLMHLIGNFQDLDGLTMQHLDEFFDDWSKNELVKFQNSFTFEENLRIKTAHRIEKKENHLDLLIQWSEFDNNFFRDDKISVTYPIEIDNDSLYWMINLWKNQTAINKEKIKDQWDYLLKDLIRKLHPKITEFHNIQDIVVDEFVNMLDKLPLPAPSLNNKTTININIFYGIHSLQFLRNDTLN